MTRIQILRTATVCLALLSGAAVYGQGPTFEAVSVKVNRSGESRSSFRGTLSGISVTNQTVIDIIRNVWNVNRLQIAGGPSWAGRGPLRHRGEGERKGEPRRAGGDDEGDARRAVQACRPSGDAADSGLRARPSKVTIRNIRAVSSLTESSVMRPMAPLRRSVCVAAGVGAEVTAACSGRKISAPSTPRPLSPPASRRLS